MVKILDCTLRDGGYYTNWDFDQATVDAYIKSFNDLPVDYLEIGYRSKPLENYLGKYFYNPIYELERISAISNKKLVIILNEKDVRPADVEGLLTPCIGLVSMVRMALDPKNLKRAIILAEEVKKLGFEVGFNVMYMSKWNEERSFINELSGINGIADYFYMVDSFGGVYPEDVIQTIELVRSYSDCKLGFHGHNNLELALVNTLTAIENGVDIVDSTVLGMGRGAGNLKTELLLTVLNSRYSVDVDFNALGNAEEAFKGLLSKHEWGTNLPYMISGSNSLPQKDVMDWVTARFYSFNSIIRALGNKKAKVEDNQRLPSFNPSVSYKKALIIGGGPSALEHSRAIIDFINNEEDICVIHASSKNSLQYKSLEADQYYCLVGNEGHRLENVFKDLVTLKGECVLPPYPRKMGTYIPPSVSDKCYQLDSVDFTKTLFDSHTALSLQTALTLGAEELYLVGYDGYQEVTITQIERNLVDENEYLFTAFIETQKKGLISLTPTKYKNLETMSVYSFLYDK